jgi:hypothetical protein
MMLSNDDIKDMRAFLDRLTRRADAVSSFLWDSFSRTLRGMLTNYKGQAGNERQARARLIQELNGALCSKCIYEERRFAGVHVTDYSRRLARQKLRPEDLARVNRLLLEQAYPEISRNAYLQRLEWLEIDAVVARPISIRPMEGIKQRILDRIGMGLYPERVIDGVLRKSDYVLTVNFTRRGTQRVVAALGTWARKEARRFPRAARAKAAEPPFDCLKWLAAYRLEHARRKADVSFETVQTVLREHEKQQPVECAEPTLPIYDNHGGWSRAKAKAKALLEELGSDPNTFEKRILF